MMLTVNLPANIQQLNVLNKMLADILTGNLEKYLINTQLITEELLTNICSYAYDSKAGNVKFSCGVATFDGKNVIRISFEDSGVPFDPFSQQRPDTTKDALDDRVEGGLGITLIKKIASHYVYSRKNDKNYTDIFIDPKG